MSSSVHRAARPRHPVVGHGTRSDLDLGYDLDLDFVDDTLVVVGRSSMSHAAVHPQHPAVGHNSRLGFEFDHDLRFDLDTLVVLKSSMSAADYH